MCQFTTAEIQETFENRSSSEIRKIYFSFNEMIIHSPLFDKIPNKLERRFILENAWIRFWKYFYLEKVKDLNLSNTFYSIFKNEVRSVIKDFNSGKLEFQKPLFSWYDFEILSNVLEIQNELIADLNKKAIKDYPIKTYSSKGKDWAKNILQEASIDLAIRFRDAKEYGIKIERHGSVYYYFKGIIQNKIYNDLNSSFKYDDVDKISELKEDDWIDEEYKEKINSATLPLSEECQFIIIGRFHKNWGWEELTLRFNERFKEKLKKPITVAALERKWGRPQYGCKYKLLDNLN